MKALIIILLVIGFSNCSGCSSVKTITPTPTYVLNCPAIDEEREALQNLTKFEESYKETKKYFYQKCRHPVSLYKRHCMQWMNYMVLLEMQYIKLQLEYERASRCTIEELAILKKLRRIKE